MNLKRRDFINGIGGFALGVTAGSGTAYSGPVSDVPELPWAYEKLDVEETRKLGHEFCYNSNCASGVFKAVISQLREKVGFPYTRIPLDAYSYAGVGVFGWGTLCGALNSAGGIITLAAGKEMNNSLMNELMGWYTLQAFPSDAGNACAESSSFLVDRDVCRKILPQSVSNSPFCHLSVSLWCDVSGYASLSPERSERCARVTGDVAAKTVELLNALKDGVFTGVYETPQDIKRCTACHYKGENFRYGQSTIGKINCLSCHDSHF